MPLRVVQLAAERPGDRRKDHADVLGRRAALVAHEVAAAVVEDPLSPDERRLASTGADAVARVWAVDLDDLVALARDRACLLYTSPSPRDRS